MQKKAAIVLLTVAALLAVVVAAAVYGQSSACVQTLTVDGTVEGQWASDSCQSEASLRGYAHYYTFTLGNSSEVTITLASTDADPYLYLREGNSTSGAFLHENDDHEGSYERSQIQETLGTGTYTAEATTYAAGLTGSFTITVNGISPAPAATPGATPTATPEPTPQSTPGATPQPTVQPTPQPTSAPESLSQMVERVRPAVVKITDGGGVGSGVIYKTEDMNAYIVTNQHVVDNTLTVDVLVGDAATYTGTVLGVDETRDLAVVRICCGEFTALEFGDSLNVQVGDAVVAIGYARDDIQPTAIEGPSRVIVPGIATVTQGIVSAFRYDTPTDTDLIQTDASINPGNSGGPLLTTGGDIVGINTFILRDTEGLNYAVSETTVQEHLPGLSDGSSPPQVVERPPVILRSYLTGPDAGHFHHNPLSTSVGLVSAGIPPRKNVLVEAQFENPYSGLVHAFSYGFMIRDHADSDLRFYVHSDGRWAVTEWTRGSGFREIAQGQTGNLLLTGTGRHNHLLVEVFESSGTFWLNGHLLADPGGSTIIDLGTGTGSGRVHIANGLEADTERSGAITHYHELLVDEFVVYGVVTDADVRDLLTRRQPDSSLPANTKSQYQE